MIPNFTDLPIYVQNENQQNYNEELSQTLRQWLSSNGWTLPLTSAANITLVAPSMPNGTVWYDSDNDVFVGKTDSGLMKFTMTAWP